MQARRPATMTTLIVGRTGEVTLPTDVRERYGLTPDTPLRVVETRGGILLVPQTAEPMSNELAQELKEWQGLAAEAWAQFPYEDMDP
jgi:bifunctional DNA-binding transcriptional regulator/antitoxin component of YhaV-PrlF toxin-antitoxin module